MRGTARIERNDLSVDGRMYCTVHEGFDFINLVSLDWIKNK